ncbi:MAG: hypothetical protein NW206_06255 [Hyphomonadaceae bacterium]|nr:hypothetical protein [Hyphomonadaceae bacterium]
MAVVAGQGNSHLAGRQAKALRRDFAWVKVNANLYRTTGHIIDDMGLAYSGDSLNLFGQFERASPASPGSWLSHKTANVQSFFFLFSHAQLRGMRPLEGG